MQVPRLWQWHSWACSQGGGPWEKVHLNNGKSCWTEVRDEENSERNSPASTKVRAGGGGASAAHGEEHGETDIYTAAYEAPMQKWVYPEGLQTMEGPTQAAGMCEKEGAADSSCYGLTPTSIPHMPCTTWGGGQKGALKLETHSALGIRYSITPRNYRAVGAGRSRWRSSSTPR